MAANARHLLRDVLLIGCGAAAGAVGGLLAVDAPPADTLDVDALRARIEALEARPGPAAATAGTPRRRRVEAEGGETPTVEGDRGAANGSAAEDGPREAPHPDAAAGDGPATTERVAVTPEFVGSVRAALDEIRKEDARSREIQGLRDERAKYQQELERRLVTYQELLGLSDEQVSELRTTAQEGMDDLLRARARGVEGEELAAMERARQREIRDVIGGATYRDMRKLQLDEMARPTIVNIAGQAGVDKEQRDRIERLLDEHIESLVDMDVRSRTEELSAEERQAIREKMDAANRAAWDRLRNEILDDEQRERVPKRLR